jgi:hypothetical protein
MIGTQINDDQSMFRTSTTNGAAEPVLHRKNARKYGYNGVTCAVGPVNAPYGELNPSPRTIALATEAISPPACHPNHGWCATTTAIGMRARNAARTIQATAVASERRHRRHIKFLARIGSLRSRRLAIAVFIRLPLWASFDACERIVTTRPTTPRSYGQYSRS